MVDHFPAEEQGTNQIIRVKLLFLDEAKMCCHCFYIYCSITLITDTIPTQRPATASRNHIKPFYRILAKDRRRQDNLYPKYFQLHFSFIQKFIICSIPGRIHIKFFPRTLYSHVKTEFEYLKF